MFDVFIVVTTFEICAAFIVLDGASLARNEKNKIKLVNNK